MEADPSFGDILKDLGSAFLTLPLIATLSQIAIAKAFCESIYDYIATLETISS